MMGIREIKEANRSPRSYAKASLSDGQARRNDSVGAYWSETPADHATLPETVALWFEPGIPRVPAKPPLYFDGVRLAVVLDERANEAMGIATKLRLALQGVQRAKGISEMTNATEWLQGVIADIQKLDDATNINVRMLVNDLAKQIDMAAPRDPKGYIPQMGLHHAMHPIRKTVDRIIAAFKR